MRFVANEALFARAVCGASYGTYFSDAFADDFAHTTPAGSRLLAGNVARTLVREVLRPCSK